ncbi:MFS transporter [Oceanobacillus longus]|uniref:MFS transporter n=1 Tax=Oceanobacillus longus TaxID=930120 RepID=A0ABV8GZB2_9BACI
MQAKKFGVKDQFGYSFGDMGGSFVNLYIDAFFLTFCTYVLGVSPYYMGMLFLVARIWDAFSDVIMGSIPDRWKLGKSGDKFKPYIKVAMFPLALAPLFAFADVSSFSSTMLHIWITVVYLFYGMAYTAVSIPYGSMAAVITQDSVERTKLSRARTMGALIPGILTMAIVPLLIFDSTGNVIPESFFNIGLIFGVLSILCYVGLLKFSTERIRDDGPKEEKEKYTFKEVLKAVGKNRPLIGVMVATIGIMIQGIAAGQLGAHLFKEYYGVPQALSFLMLGMIAIMFVLFPFIPKLTKRFGKRNLILATGSFSLVAALFLFFVPIPNPYVFIALFTLVNISLAVFQILVWAIVTDCLDYNEYITGKRFDGTIYAIYTFSRKVGTGIASSAASFGLGAIGFVSGASSQTPQVTENIRYLFTGIPVVGAIIVLIGIGFIYNLTGPKTEAISAELEERRQKAS